jgi:hypothetical protein
MSDATTFQPARLADCAAARTLAPIINIRGVSMPRRLVVSRTAYEDHDHWDLMVVTNAFVTNAFWFAQIMAARLLF